MEDAAVIAVADGVRLSQPVQVLYVNTLTAGTPTASYPRTVVSVGNGAELHLKQSLVTINSADSSIVSGVALDTAAGKDDISFVNGNTRMVVGRDARVVHTFTQELSQQTKNMEVVSGTMQGNSSYEVSVLQLGASLGRINVHMDIQVRLVYKDQLMFLFLKTCSNH
jgi:Fe-S cluster assembly scaffold protein SufB